MWVLRKSQGFSLIELMVVVSITTLITGLAIPKFAAFKIRAARAEVNYHLKGMYATAHSFRAESDRFPTYVNHPVTTGANLGCLYNGHKLNLPGNCSNGIKLFMPYDVTSMAKLTYFYGYSVSADAQSFSLGAVLVKYANFSDVDGNPLPDILWYGKPPVNPSICKPNYGVSVQMSSEGIATAIDPVKYCF